MDKYNTVTNTYFNGIKYIILNIFDNPKKGQLLIEQLSFNIEQQFVTDQSLLEASFYRYI
jgi:hypothetical protein